MIEKNINSSYYKVKKQKQLASVDSYQGGKKKIIPWVLELTAA